MGIHGRLIIFNMAKFKTQKSFPENKYDVDRLEKTFSYFGASVRVYTNLTLLEIKAKMEAIEKYDFKDYKYLAVVILSHGARKLGVDAYDIFFNLDDQIVFPIQRNRSLKYKPKLFIIDTCRGPSEFSQYNSSGPHIPKYDGQTMRIYSASEGFESILNDTGSIFIQILCHKLQKYGKSLNVKQILEKTVESVKKETRQKQKPTIESNFDGKETNAFVIGRRRNHSRERDHGGRRNHSRERRTSIENLEKLIDQMRFN